ncbi:MAG TPA: alpha/beta hydrolase [Deltaproteobacteria bacterium]|nr:alpha/beta hydrolase [Deltaproteobacteria bacterium]
MDGHGKTLLILLVTCLLLGGCVSGAVYHPMGTIRHTPAEAGLAYEDVRFKAADGIMLSGWWVPAERPRATVLFCHGNGGNISSCMDTLMVCRRLNLNVFLFDYRGYGSSEGSPSEQGTYLDADAAWGYLTSERKLPPEGIIVWGRSLGGAIAARTAASRAPGCVIIESAFTSLPDLVNDRFWRVPDWVLEGYTYDTRSSLERINVPVLIIHSPDDEVIPFRHGRDLYGSIRGEGAFVEIRGSHNRGFIESMVLYESSIRAFLDGHLKGKEIFGQ